MDKFVNQYRQQLHDNPNATNHLNNTPNTRNQISNYFKVTTNNKPNEISIDCSSDENQDNEIEITDDQSEDIELLSNAQNRRKESIKKKQKSLIEFLKNTDEIKAEDKRFEYSYLYIAPLMNERHLFELTELTGIRNIGSARRLSRICSQTVCNLNSDILYRRNLHLIINNDNLYRLPMRHSMNVRSLMNDFDYISCVKFDKMGSLFCASSTNGKIGIFDFDRFQTQWNYKARIPYNNHIMKLQKENQDKLESGEDDIIDIKEDAIKNAASMENMMDICIDSHFRIEDMEWSHNMNDIAVCGHNGGSLHVYDLRRLSNKAKYKLKSNSKGNHPLLSIKYSPSQSTLIMSGDRMGRVYGWDLNNKTSKASLQFNTISKQTTLIGNKYNSRGMNMSNFAVKHLSISSDGILLYVVRENGFIHIMDIRKPGYNYKTIDLWRCSFDDDDKNKNKNKNVSFYDENISTSHRARIDDAIISQSMNTALLKLQNNSLVNVHLETNTIRKTYQDHNNNKQEAINVAWLSKVMQRRMCSFQSYGMPEMIVSGSFNKEMVVMDLSTELDAHYAEKEYRKKRVNLGLLDQDTKTKSEDKSKMNLNEKSYGKMGYCQLSDILTSCSLHPKSLYTVCGTLNNCLEIVACASNPF